MKTESTYLRYSWIPLGMILMTIGCDSPEASGLSDSVSPASKPSTTGNTASQELASTSTTFYTVEHYGDDRNAEDDLKMTLARASAENKRVLLQVGGDWCGWCKLLTGFIESNEKVRTAIDKNYLLMKVTFTPEQKNEPFLSKFPAIKGYPHLFVLDKEGTLLHSQDTGVLEQGRGYNEEVVLEFLDKWKP